MLLPDWTDAWNERLCRWTFSKLSCCCCCCCCGLLQSKLPGRQAVGLDGFSLVPAAGLCWMELGQRSSRGPPLCQGTTMSLHAALRYMLVSRELVGQFAFAGKSASIFLVVVGRESGPRKHLHVSTGQCKSCGPTGGCLSSCHVWSQNCDLV